MEKVQNLFASTTDSAVGNVANLSLDTIILIIIFFVFFIYSIKFGKRSIILLILSFYISIPLISFFPYFDKISFFGDTEKALLYSQIGLFVIIIFISSIILDRIVNIEVYYGGFRKLIESIFLGVASGGLLIAVSYHILNISILYDFGNYVDYIFASQTLFFWWLIAPFIVIFLTTRR